MKINLLYIWLILLTNYSFGQTVGGLNPVNKGEKWGVVNSSGKTIVPIVYDEVKIFDDGYVTAKLEKELSVYTSTGTKVTKQEYKRVGPESSSQKTLFKNGACQVCVNFNNDCGLIDVSGYPILALEYDDIGDFNEGLAPIFKKIEDKPNLEGYKRGYVDTKGKIVVPLIYDWGRERFQNGFVKVQLNGKEGFIDKLGKVVVPFEYIPNSYDYNSTFHFGLVAVNKNDKWGFVDKNGNEVIPLEYEFVWGFHDSLAAVKKNGKWGFVNLTNELVIPFEYDGPTLPEFHEGFAAMEIEGKIGFIDKMNQSLTAFKYYDNLCNLSHFRDIHTYYKFKDGIALVKDKNCNIGVINSQGQEIVPLKYSSVWIEEDGTIIAKDKRRKRIYKN